MSDHKETEDTIINFAGHLTQLYLETIAGLIGSSGAENAKTRNDMLLKIRDAELAKVDAIERQLGISPTTAEIRKWFKQEKRGNNFEGWIRARS